MSDSRPSAWKTLASCTVAVSALLVFGCSGGGEDQKSFASPEAALQALAQAIEQHDAEALLSVLGSEYRDRIVTPDWNAEREARERIASAARERHELKKIGEDRLELVLGAEQWPFPFPLTRNAEGTWQFDTAEGMEVILDRRIGRNELTAIAIANAYVDAQIDYAQEDRDGDEVREYARRLASTPGQRDGLYWESGPDEEPSPFGPLVEGAERYLETREPGDPIRGYYFQVLEGQGTNPPGGAYDYVINGNMIAGFALLAYPADYGNSGIMTFVVSHRGKIHQKDLGAFTGMDRYDPDETWTEVEGATAP